MKLSFARAWQSQNQEIVDLMTDAFTPYVNKLGGGPVSGPYPELVAALDSGSVYVGLDGSEIVGVVVVTRHADQISIDQLGVAPTRQGQGIGSWMLRQIEQMARREQVKSLTLFTAEIMSDVVDLYKRHGFSEVRKALPAHGEDQHLRVHMIKHL